MLYNKNDSIASFYFQAYLIFIRRPKYILGKIIPIFEERLRGIGGWLDINGEAIFGSTYWIHQNDSLTTDTQVWYTTKNDIIVIIC